LALDLEETSTMNKANANIRRIVVGIDGSEPAKAALAWTIDLAKHVNADVVAVYAMQGPSAVEYAYGYQFVTPPNLDDQWRGETQREFEEEWCKPLEDSGLAYRAIFEDGRAADVIASVAERFDADLVVVGRRGRGNVAELLLGSVSHELSHRCRRPVVLISRPNARALPRERVTAVREA
jgi:universal stress protein A